MNATAALLGLAAYGCLGVAYLTWRTRATGYGTPMGLLRHLDERAENDPEAAPIRELPIPVIVALASAVYVAALTFWPILLVRYLYRTATKQGGNGTNNPPGADS